MISDQEGYILCTRSKSLHRKSVQVCLKCRYRKKCKDFKSVKEKKPQDALDQLCAAFEEAIFPKEVASSLREALLEIKALC